MSWREILNPEPSDKSDKSPQNDHFGGNGSQNDPFSHYCHRDSGIENDESKDKRSSGIPKAHTVSADTMAVPPIQVNQAAQDYRRYGYVKIFSTVLNRAVYLAKHEQAAKRVPDRDIPVYTESDIEAVKGLDPEVAKVLLEARILFGGPIKIEDSAQPRQPLDGKGIARSFYGKAGEL